MLRIQKFFGYFKSGTVDLDAPSAQPLAKQSSFEKQQQSQSHAAAVGPAVSCQPAEQQQRPEQNGQAEPLEAEKLQSDHGPGWPHMMRASSRPSAGFQDDDQQLVQCGNGGSMSSALGGHIRQPSLLSESGRASRRAFLMRTDSFGDSSVPPVLQQRDSLASTPPEQPSSSEPFWANSSWSFGSHSDRNQRTHMEDRIACQDLTDDPAFAGCKRAGFFAVFDGHAGHEAAEYLEANLLSYVLNAGAAQLRADPLTALASAVKRAEGEILSKFLAARCNAGSTLLALLLVDDKLYIANVGDSRAVMGRGAEPQQLTRDHKPACSVEQQRIEADDPAAEISCDGYMYGELAVARAIGSAHIKRDPSKRALIPTPDLISVQLQAEDDFIVLATDGLWDKVDNVEVVSVARRSLASSRGGDAAAGDEALSRAAAASRALVDRALRRSSHDNISVVMLLLHGRAVTLPKSNSMLFKRAQLSTLAGTDSPRCSTPCSGISTPAAATPRSGTPVQPHQNAGTAGSQGQTPSRPSVG